MEHLSRFGRFAKRKKLRPTDLSRLSGKSRRHIYYLLSGEVSPTLECMLAVHNACEEILGAAVDIAELFDFAALQRRAS